MAIQIIGAPRASEDNDSPLPKVEVSFPQPGALPANAAVFTDEQVKALLHHENGVVRGFAVEQAAQREGEEWSRALMEKVADADEVVASDAIHALEVRKYQGAAEVIGERFANGSTRLVVSAARALGELAPEKLLELVRARGRLEDEAYGATATAVACIGSSEVVEYLDKALNRSGALSPERRGALFGAALLSGSTALANRVIVMALADSKKEEPEGASFPSRGALSAIAGMPLSMSTKAAGLELYDFARRVIESEILPLYEGERKDALEDALKKKNTGALLSSLAHVLELPEPNFAAGDRTVQSMPKRRRGLLTAMLERKAEIGALEAAPAAVFVAAAAQSSAAIVAGGANDAHSPAIIALVKALESTLDAPTLAAMNLEELTKFFKEKSERQMRRVHNILTHERTRQLGTLKRFANAIADAGHAQGLFEAAADVEDEGVHTAILDAVARNREAAEAIVVDALTRSPLEPKIAILALEAVEKVRTQRVGTAIGRRFLELRELARPLLIRAVLRLGDPKLLPLVESRAFPDEPEELAYALLSLANNAPKSERLDKAVARTLTPGSQAPEAEANIMLPLKCKKCKETLSYGFDRVLLDVESKDPYGDPAYVGDTACKACGTVDQLEATEQAGQIITSMMLDFLQAARRGPIRGTPVVAPAQTAHHGKKMGFAAALRALDKEIADSPQSIRPRLHRARMRLILRRKGVEEDAQAVLEADPRSPEGRALFASIAARDGDPAKSMEHAVIALRSLREDPPARVYDADDASALADSIEDLIVELERQGAAVPADIDFSAARVRRSAFDAERAAVPEDTQEDEENHAPALPGSKVDDESLARAGRNDTCPCGSGKKFKKCHGKGK